MSEALEREELSERRQARYRANVSFAYRTALGLVLLVTMIGSMFFGWPVSHRDLTSLLQHLPM